MTTGGFSSTRLARVRDVLQQNVDAGEVPGAVAAVVRNGEIHMTAVGDLAFEGDAPARSMTGDTIYRMGSTTKPVVAAGAMTLVEDGTVRLDDAVDDLLPELANMSVLVDPTGSLDNVVPAKRPITLRDLLTFRLGTGMALDRLVGSPIAAALAEVERGEGDELEPPPGEWIRRLGSLPLVYQPGERWMYETGANVLSVLIRRVTGKTVHEALRERICEPLGMKDTGFYATGEQLDRLATSYAVDPENGGLSVTDIAPGYFTRPPAFESGGGGLLSTPDDFVAFASMLLGGGVHAGQRVLSRPSVALMTTDNMTTEHKATNGFRPGYFDNMGWGFGLAPVTRRTGIGPSVGSYGWPGYWGTGWYNDPAERMTIILMIQRAHAPVTLPLFSDLCTAAYQAIDD